FRTESGKVSLNGVSGEVSGNSESGNIDIKIVKWMPRERAFIESIRGHLRLTLPRYFSGEVDFCSLHGELETQLVVQKDENRSSVGPQPKNRLTGRVRDGGKLLKLFTEYGDLRVFKGKI